MTPTEREMTTDEQLEQALIYIDSLHEIIESIKVEHDKVRNQAIQDCIDAINNTTGDQNVIPILEALKTIS